MRKISSGKENIPINVNENKRDVEVGARVVRPLEETDNFTGIVADRSSGTQKSLIDDPFEKYEMLDKAAKKDLNFALVASGKSDEASHFRKNNHGHYNYSNQTAEGELIEIRDLNRIPAPQREDKMIRLLDQERFNSTLEKMMNGEPLPPIRLSTEPNRPPKVMDGFHRYYAACALGYDSVPVAIKKSAAMEERKPAEAKWQPRKRLGSQEKT